MAEATEPRIQFGDEIKPASTNTYQLPRREGSASSGVEKRKSYDPEDNQKRSAFEDLNRKKKQKYSGWVLTWLAYQSIGTIYGDIGTSPLYVYSSTFSSQPSYDDLVGALSIIIWSLTLMVTIKYVCIVLSADDDGEGGTFALYSLLARYTNIVRRDPNVAATYQMDRYLTGDLKPTQKSLRSFIENSTFAKNLLRVIGVLGVSMVMADGVLTPAQSVLGAIQGLKVATDNISTSTIIGVTCAILILLFLVQPFGISRIASAWAPIVIVWLLFNLCAGIYNLALHDHSVLKAFSPYFAGAYLVRNGQDGWRSLGGLLLAFTGVEALFADLGAFSQRAIQISWLFVAYPCLLLAYIGQAAYISDDITETAFTNPFFYTVPPGSFYFSLVIAILAAIVASQAMITSSFQLLLQIMNMSYFPHIKTRHTSKTFHGQVYMPLANWLLMIGTVIVTAVYNNTTALGNAYGVCVIIVTFITTCMVSLVALVVWRIHFVFVIPVFLIFACLDGAYMSSALTKVPTGAWFTLMLAVILSSIFILWRYGKEMQWDAEAEDRIQPSHLMTISPAGEVHLSKAFGGGEVRTVNGLGIFFDKVGDMVPLVFAQFVRKFAARPEIVVLFHMRPLPIPSVPESERHVLSRTAIPNCYRITVRHGYMDKIITPDLGKLIVEQLILFITRENGTLSETSSASSKQHSPEIQAEIDALDRARAAQTVYVLGKEQLTVRKGSNIVRWAILQSYLFIREYARTKMADLNIPADNTVEMGFLKEI